MEINETMAIVGLTAVLVGVTVWYAIETHRISKAAVESASNALRAAEAAERSAAIAELDLRLRSAPVVIARVMDSAQLGEMLEIMNVGDVAAINIVAAVETPDGSSYWRRDVADVLPALGEGSTIGIPFPRNEVPLYEGAKATITLEYQHPAGDGYRLELPFQGSSSARLLRENNGRWIPFSSTGD